MIVLEGLRNESRDEQRMPQFFGNEESRNLNED
jgi:hypothetical protein